MSEFNPFEDSQSFDRELIPEGPHAARCVRVIEIGKQYSQKFDTESDKVIIVFSVPGVTINIKGEEKQKFISNPFGITKSSFERSTLRQYAKALCPEGGTTLGDFLDKPCQIYVVHAGEADKRYDKLDSVSPILPGIEVPPPDTEPYWFQWNSPDPEVWKKIPPYTQETILKATNYPGSYVEEMVNSLGNTTDDLPI